MKNIKITFLIIPFLFLFCTNQKSENENRMENCITYESGFTICRDTVFFNVLGERTHTLMHQDKIYVLFRQKVLKFDGIGKRWLGIFSNGNVEKIIDCPEDIKTWDWNLDFYAYSDSIIFRQKNNNQCYYLDTQSYIWEMLEEISKKNDDLIFEDEKFYVYSLSFGEFGGKTWFKDKTTGIEDLIETGEIPLINKIDTTYYLTNAFRILKIENPLLLNKCDDDVTYENGKKTGKNYTWRGKSIGFDIVYEDVCISYFNDHTIRYNKEINITNSFVWQDELFHIYDTDTATYIAKIENDSIKIIQKVSDESIYLETNTQNEQMFILADIVDNKMFIYYFVNEAELYPKPFSKAKVDSIFVKRFELILSNLGNLRLKDVVLEENKWESFYLNPFIANLRIVENSESYLIQEDSLILNSISYFTEWTNDSDSIKIIAFDWKATDYNRHYAVEKLKTKALAAKLFFLETFLNERLGQPVSTIKEKSKPLSIIWKTPNGFNIELYESFPNEIRLGVHKDEITTEK